MSDGASAAVPKFAALVLAGSRGPDDPVARARGVAHKCLAPVAGVPMLVRVVETLVASPSVGQIAVALEDPALFDQLPALHRLRESGRCAAVDTGATPSLSVLRALDQAPYPLPWLVVTGDHPLLTPEIVEHFCAEARATGADLAVGLTPASTIRNAYPEAQRTYLRFQDEHYSGANLYALLGPEACRAIAFWRRAELERKRPWRLVRAFGWRPLLAYLLGRLTLDDGMARASRITGARLAAISLPFAEAAIDVDKPADLALVETILARRPQRATSMAQQCAQERAGPMAGETRTPVLTGGCQCGAVRYALYAEPSSADICHCRMCQKAVGNLFMAVAGVPEDQLVWTRGAPATFRSSSAAERGFCPDCGTPLTFRYPARDEINVTLGSLDEPARAKPSRQYGIESRVPWWRELFELPGITTADDPPPGGLDGLESYQHRDGD